MTRIVLAVLAAATLATGASAQTPPPGCNGHVDMYKFGCAASQHNVGPQFPYWNGGKPTPTPAPSPVAPPALQPR